jgi:hypothetical protein
MQPTEKKSYKKLVFGVVLLLVIVSGVAVGLFNYLGTGPRTESASSTKSPSPSPKVATKEQVKQNISDLGASIRQAAADQAAAKAAQNDKQIKVGI